jgi:hypothetical protein
MWNASCGVLPGWQEDGVKGGKGREVLSLTIAGYAWSRAEGTGHWNLQGPWTEENRIQRAGVDVTLEAGKKNSPNRYELYFVLSNVNQHSQLLCRLSAFIAVYMYG